MAIDAGLKEIEQTAGFSKEVSRSSSNLNGNKLLYTYAKKSETATPYGNLFRSFNFPITDSEISIYNSSYQGTALEYLNQNEIIVIEIPKGEYGELIDGKTFQLKLPVTLNSVETATTIYGSYFGYLGTNASSFLGGALNRQFSERNQNYFGFTPTPDNDFNTNITFLYSNDIQKPKNKGDLITVLTATTISVTGNNDNANKQTIAGVSFSTGDSIKINITSTNPNPNIKVEVDGFNILPLNINGSNTNLALISQAGINSVSPKIYQDTTQTNPTPISVTIEIQQNITTDLEWEVWSSTNKFPTFEGDESKKIYAAYDGVKIGGDFNPQYDKPVGILFQDKGFAVITDPTLVTGFRYSAGTSSGFNEITSGNPYTGDINFAKIYFTNTSISNSQFDSITTEFIQNIICVAGPNQFASTTNSTYDGAYDETVPVNQKPTFITSIGLYNEAKELIGIAKLSEPIKKLPETIIPFNIRLVV